MLVAIDIGNTNVKLGLFKNDELVDSLRMAASTKTSDEYWLVIKDMLSLKGVKIDDISAAVISCVNPNLSYTFTHMIENYFHVTPLIVGAGVKTGLNIKYDNPKEVGADRIVNSVAAYRTYGECIVVDCGTATTFNVISKSGEFLGGAISFGLKGAAEALSRSAARLPKIELATPPSVIAKSTITNMQSGVVYGFIGMVESMVRRLKEQANMPNAKVVATGGISEIVKHDSAVIDVLDRTLTLRGLNIIYNLNKVK